MNGSTVSSSLDLLRRLEPAVRPETASGKDGGVPTLFESRSFDELLHGAAAGQVRSGRPVQVSESVHPSLDAAQLERLGAAADRAEASGARRALMMIDGRGLVMDIATRSVSSEMKPGDVGGVLQVDAAMVVGGEEHAPTSKGSPFAGLNALTRARISGASESNAGFTTHVTQAHELIAPKSRSAR